MQVAGAAAEWATPRVSYLLSPGPSLQHQARPPARAVKPGAAAAARGPSTTYRYRALNTRGTRTSSIPYEAKIAAETRETLDPVLRRQRHNTVSGMELSQGRQTDYSMPDRVEAIALCRRRRWYFLLP